MAYTAICNQLHFRFDLMHCLNVRYLTATVKFLPSVSQRQNESVTHLQTISNMITKLAPLSAVTIFQPTRIHSVERGICPIAASYVML